MTMLPPKIKKLPNLHNPQSGYIGKTQQTSGKSNGGFIGTSKMVR